jgi:hypothetical protein
MAIEFACPMCHKQYRLKDELAGKTAKCGCGHKMKVPQPSQQATAPAAPRSVGTAPTVAKGAQSPAKIQPAALAQAKPAAPAKLPSQAKPLAPPKQPSAKVEPDNFAGIDNLNSGDMGSWLDEELQVAAASPAPIPASARCPACDDAMAAGAVLCTKCGYDKRTGQRRALTRVAPEDNEGKSDKPGKVRFAASLLRGTICSFIAAMIGAAIWAVLAYLTKREFGLAAWALGGLTGAGMSIAHDDDDGTFAGIIAGGMSIVGIIAAKIMIVAILIGMVVAGAAAELKDPQKLERSILAMTMVEGKLKAKGININNATEAQADAAMEEAEQEVEKLSDAEVKARLEQHAKQVQRAARESETIDEQRTRLAIHMTQQKLRSQGTNIAEASADQLKAVKQDKLKQVESLTAEQLKERLDAAADDKKAEFDDDDEEKFTDDAVAPAEANQPAAPVLVAPGQVAQPPAIGAGAKIGAFAMLLGMLFTPMDGIFILLAVVTAYKVGSGKVTG